MAVDGQNTRTMKTFCAMLIAEGVIPGNGEGFSMRYDDELLYPVATDGGIAIAACPMDGLDFAIPVWVKRHRDIHSRKKGVMVLIFSRLPNTLACAKAGINIPPLLDDFAQLVGVDAKSLERDSGKPSFAGTVIKGLALRNAVLIKDAGGLCAAGDFDDAHAVVQVLEKNCRAVVDMFFFGGGRPITWLDAWLMRLVYRYKYAKKKTPGENSGSGL